MYDILEETNYTDRKEISGSQGLGLGERLTTQKCSRILWGVIEQFYILIVGMST